MNPVFYLVILCNTKRQIVICLKIFYSIVDARLLDM